MVCHSLLQWTTFCQTSPPWPSHLGWPHRAWLSFIELDKAVVCVIRLASFLWLWFQCICPLMPSRNTYRLTWVSLTLDVGISSRLLQQSAAAAPYFGWGVSPHGHPSWPWTWSSSSWPSFARTAAAPWMWGCSSPDLRRVVACLGFIIWRPHEPCPHKTMNLIDKYCVCFICFTSHPPVSLTLLSLFHEIQQYWN